MSFLAFLSYLHLPLHAAYSFFNKNAPGITEGILLNLSSHFRLYDYVNHPAFYDDHFFRRFAIQPFLYSFA
ncbi:hypothetical protein MMC2321_04373 [Chitinophaga sp. MM2321]